MNERWKYQIKTGLPFGFSMPIILTLWDWYDTSFTEAFFTKKFLISVVVFIFVGVFAIGYSNWKEKQKNEMYNKN